MTNDVFRSLGIAMLVAILLVYIIMVATFRSLLNPLILLVSIPFAAVGAVLALVITGTSLGMPSLIGLLMLIGIVVTNAIVLLDLVEQFRRKGMDARTAVIEGGRRRLRPILMTAIATILALIPMALGIGGKGGFLSTPLAVVVIGGLFTSTFLTLILVPVLYLAFDRLRPAGAYEPDDEDYASVDAGAGPGRLTAQRRHRAADDGGRPPGDSARRTAPFRCSTPLLSGQAQRPGPRPTRREESPWPSKPRRSPRARRPPSRAPPPTSCAAPRASSPARSSSTS